MNSLIIGGLIAYFLVIALIGYFTKELKGLKGFVKANQTLGVLAVFAGLVMTHYGGGFVLGGAELGYKHALYGAIYGGRFAVQSSDQKQQAFRLFKQIVPR